MVLLPTLILAYYCGSDALREIIAPASNRELGLLENLQLAILVIAGYVGWRALRQSSRIWEQAFFLVLVLMVAFVFLEEIDYGVHLWGWLRGVDTENARTALNIHNQGDNTDAIKRISEIGIAAVFVVLPLGAKYIPDERIRCLIANPMIIATVAVGVAASQFAHMLDDAGFYPDGPLSGNVSEFRETITYWLLMVYALDMAFWRHTPTATGTTLPSKVQGQYVGPSRANSRDRVARPRGARRSISVVDHRPVDGVHSLADLPLVAGSAVFGVGWGITGFCPSGAISTLGLGNIENPVFILSMIAGIAVARALRQRAARLAAA